MCAVVTDVIDVPAANTENIHIIAFASCLYFCLFLLDIFIVFHLDANLDTKSDH